MAPPPTELLPALVALLDTESVTLAAQRLGVGQPAMSRTLEKLRGVTGDALLVREGRRLVRTRRASELLPEVSALLASAERLLRAPKHFDPPSAQGLVVLALGDDMQAVLAQPLLERLRRHAPGLDIRVRPVGLSSAREALRGTIDLAVMPDLRQQYAIPSFDELVLSVEYTRRFVTVSRRKRRMSLDAFLAADHVLVSPQGEEGGYVDDALMRVGKQRRVALAVPGFLAALALVRGSELLATLPEDVVRVVAPELHRHPCPVSTPELSMCLIWGAQLTSDPRHRWLREQVRATLHATMCTASPVKRPKKA